MPSQTGHGTPAMMCAQSAGCPLMAVRRIVRYSLLSFFVFRKVWLPHACACLKRHVMYASLAVE